tara:strand:- start:7226 stop:7945 length:720 start_codon:yes stop_codon:yes gene_type:complete
MVFLQSNYRSLKSTGSLKGFYDDIVYWEMAKNNNKFYVTFMKGLYAIPNNKQESIATMEISYPHTDAGLDDSSGSFNTGFNRVSAKYKAFMVDDEIKEGSDTYPASHNYNGFIPITELNGTRFFRTTVTSSNTETRKYFYEQFDGNAGSVVKTREIEASYFYPFSSHQLSVLRDEPTLIINLDKESELKDGLGDAGFVLIPQNCTHRIKNNIEYYLEKAGLIDKTTKTKAPDRGGYNKS